MNAKQQAITNRHLTDQAHLAPTGWTLVPDDLYEPYRLVLNFLSVDEAKELRRQLDGGSLAYKRNVLLHWYDLVEAREHLLKVDAQCRRDRTRQQPSYAEADRVKAVAKARALGLVVETESWTCDVLAVRIV